MLESHQCCQRSRSDFVMASMQKAFQRCQGAGISFQ